MNLEDRILESYDQERINKKNWILKRDIMVELPCIMKR